MTSRLWSGRLGWYINRLVAMSPSEVIHRFGELAKRRLSRRRIPVFPGGGELPVIPRLADRLRAIEDGAFPVETSGSAWRDAMAGTHRLLGVAWPPAADGPSRWHLDPISGRAWPAADYCFAIPFRHAPEFGDVKYVWELNRLQHLQAIAALAGRTTDAEATLFCRREIASWIAANPPFLGVNWASGIELALRVVTFLVVVSLLGPDAFPPDEKARLKATLAAHGYWLHRFPSRFSSANNHLVAEAAALFLLGSLAQDIPGAHEWARYGRQVLMAEIDRQIHPDGVGAEQSPTYTAFSLEWWLLCAAVARDIGAPFPAAVLDRIAAAGRFLRWILDGRDGHPRIGDDDEGRVLIATTTGDAYVATILQALAAATERGDLLPSREYASLWRLFFSALPERRPPPAGVDTFADGGYTVARERLRGRDLMLVFDHGPLGYLSIAAHGHADALAVWLHLDGQPVLVDGGTFLYHSGGRWRDHFRGTAAHNTLLVNDENSSRIAGPFNWSRKARAVLLGVDASASQWRVEAEHDGYEAGSGVRHRRELVRSPDGQIVITDRILGEGPARNVEAGFLVHPDCDVLAGDGAFAVRRSGRLLLTIRHAGPLAGRVERGQETPARGWHSPAFGHRQPAARVVFAGPLRPGERAEFRLDIAPEAP